MFVRTFILTVIFTRMLFGASAVTYLLNEGRFGDNLMSYLHAKWFAQQNHLLVLYVPFEYSSELAMDTQELNYFTQKNNYRREISLAKAAPKAFGDKTIFVCPYFPEVPSEFVKIPYYHFHIDWKDATFRSNALKMIKPIISLNLTYPPKERISIALHVREGGGYDPDSIKDILPLKIPPFSFYSQSLKVILQMFPGRTIHCQLFTDAKDPRACLNKILQELPPNIPIDFHYRQVGNKHDSSVLEDFYSLFNFDILIRPESNFSIIPSLLHDYAVVCYPKAMVTRGKSVMIDQIGIEINAENFNQVCNKR